MTAKLFLEAIAKFTLGILLIGILLFLPAGTLDYPYGWLLMAVLFIPMFFAGIVMMLKNPALLRKRLSAKERLSTQQTVLKLSGLMFLFGFVIAGLDFRFAWFPIPQWVSYTAATVFLIGYILFAEVMRENTYLSRTVEVQEGQQVIDTGLYGIVRHPMYSATLLMFLSMPLILGSLFSLIPFLFYPFLIAARIKSEEMLLTKELAGYAAYKTRVKYRLLPLIW